MRSLRIKREINGAYIVWVFCVGEDLFPVSAAVDGAIDSALGIGFVDMAEGSDVDAIGVGWVDDNFADLARLGEAD